MSNTDLGAGGDPAAGSRGGVGDAVSAVKGEAASFAAEATEKASEKVAEHTETATQTLQAFADAVRKAGDELSEGDQSFAGRVVKQAADGLESLSRSISGKQPQELMDAARRFGRENPAALVGGAVLAGLVLGRFLKSSQPAAASAPAQGFAGSDTPAATFGAEGPDAIPTNSAGLDAPPGLDPYDDPAFSDARLESGAGGPQVSDGSLDDER